MESDRPKYARVRGSLVVLLAASAVVVACEAKLPTSADVDGMTVASAERDAKQVMGGRDSMAMTTYTIDGVEATADQAHALLGDTIVRINIVRAAAAVRFKITTRTAADIAAADSAARMARLYGEMSKAMVKRSSSTPQSGSNAQVHDLVYTPSAARAGTDSTVGAGVSRMQAFTGLVFIDGVKSDPSVLRTLNRNSIKSVDVIKGAAAAAQFHDPAAAGGVIEITTKAGGGSK